MTNKQIREATQASAETAEVEADFAAIGQARN